MKFFQAQNGITLINSNPLFVDITDDLEEKLNACREYTYEIKEKDSARSIESLKTLAFIRGNQSGYKYAEGFQLIVKR